MNDIIHAIINSQPFSQRVDVPDDQIKLVLFYAFVGKKMITMDVEKEIMRHNDWEESKTKKRTSIFTRMEKTTRKYFFQEIRENSDSI